MTLTRLCRAGFSICLLAAFIAISPSSRPVFAAVDLPEERVESSPVYESADDDKYLSPGSVTVVRLSDFQGEQRTLPDFLEEVPGLRVVRLQGRNGYAVASVRGSTSSQVAVYVDGVLMNLRSEAAVDLSSIPVDSVERVEVYKGYIPARFGAQAMGGVINIVTKPPRKPETFLSFGGGSFGRYKGTLSHSMPLGGGNFFSALGYETYDGNFKYFNDGKTPYDSADDYYARRMDNGFDNMDALLKWEDGRWKARASWVRRNRDIPREAPGEDKPGASPRPGAVLNTDRWDVSLGGTRNAGGVNWGWEAMYTGQNKEYDSRRGTAPSQVGAAYVTKSEYDSSRAGFSLNADWTMGERHFFEFLGDYSEEKLTVHKREDNPSSSLGGIDSYSGRDWSLSLQDTITLDKAGTLLFTPSVRWHKGTDDSRFTWQSAISKEQLFGLPELMFKTAFGTYSRSPNTYERYGDGAFIRPASDNLKWETGTQFDAGLIWTGRRKREGGVKLDASVSAFWRDSDWLIEFDMYSPTYGEYKNIASAAVRGIEAEAALDWEKWNVSLSGTWADGENKTFEPGSVRAGGKPLPNRPDWSGAARVTYKFMRYANEGRRRNGSLFAEYRYTGKNYADLSAKVIFDARGVWNVGVRYELSRTMTLTAGIDDLFNDADGWRMMPETLNGPTKILDYPVEGRTFYITAEVKF